MPKTIGTDSSNKICSVSEKGIISDDACVNLYDALADYTSGNPLPDRLGDMMGGTFTPNGFYVAPPAGPDWVERNRAWEDAVNDWMDNGIMLDTDKWRRCVKAGDKSRLDDSDWSALIAAYPAA